MTTTSLPARSRLDPEPVARRENFRVREVDRGEIERNEATDGLGRSDGVQRHPSGPTNEHPPEAIIPHRRPPRDRGGHVPANRPGLGRDELELPARIAPALPYRWARPAGHRAPARAPAYPATGRMQDQIPQEDRWARCCALAAHASIVLVGIGGTNDDRTKVPSGRYSLIEIRRFRRQGGGRRWAQELRGCRRTADRSTRDGPSGRAIDRRPPQDHERCRGRQRAGDAPCHPGCPPGRRRASPRRG
jgi:hypothetical protein